MSSLLIKIDFLFSDYLGNLYSNSVWFSCHLYLPSEWLLTNSKFTVIHAPILCRNIVRYATQVLKTLFTVDVWRSIFHNLCIKLAFYEKNKTDLFNCKQGYKLKQTHNSLTVNGFTRNLSGKKKLYSEETKW